MLGFPLGRVSKFLVVKTSSVTDKLSLDVSEYDASVVVVVFGAEVAIIGVVVVNFLKNYLIVGTSINKHQ